MKRPSPFVLVTLLFIVALRIVDNVLAKCLLIGAIVVVGCIVGYPLGARVYARALRVFGRGRPLAAIGALLGIVALAAFGAMIDTRPRSQVTFRPGPGAKGDVAQERGFYGIETDPTRNQYVWTGERATLVYDFLVHRPITLTVMMRSAAVAGGPDAPVQVLANGREVGALHPDPANPSFQSLRLRFVPFDWGGEQTEIKLVPTTFKPKGDPRTLGTMVQSVVIDKSEAWSPLGQRMWLAWALPVLALIVIGLVWAAWRLRSSTAGYGAIMASLLGGACAIAIGVLIQRIGFIQRDTYYAWAIGSGYFALFFVGAALVSALGPSAVAGRISALLSPRTAGPRWAHARTWMAARLRPVAAEPVATRAAIRRDIAIVFMLALGVRLLWATITPPWQAPDEPDHYTYTEYIVEQAAIPHPPFPSGPTYSVEFTQSATQTFLYPLTTSAGSRPRILLQVPVWYDYAAVRSYAARPTERRTAAAARATPYPPLYYLLAAIPYKLFQGAPILARLFAIRCATAILGALTCVFGYLMAYELRRERRWGWALALCLALMPMFVFITAVANNDAAMNLGATALMWLLVRLYRQETISPVMATVVGLASGLTLLAKPGPLPVVVIMGIFMVVRLFPRLTRPLRHSRQRLTALGGYIAGGVLGYGPWVLFRYAYYGDLSQGVGSITPLVRALAGMRHVAAATGAAPLAQAPYPLSGYLRHERSLPHEYFRWVFVKSVWGDFGWLDVPMPDSTFLVITVICVIGIAGLIVQLALQPARRPMLLLLVGVVLAQVAFLFLFVDYFTGYRPTGTALGLQGRYLFPVLAPALFLLLSGWDHLFRERPVALRLAPFVMAGIQLVGLAAMFAYYYGVKIGWS